MALNQVIAPYGNMITRDGKLTTQDNEAAQKLYDGIGANKSSWLFYAKEI